MQFEALCCILFEASFRVSIMISANLISESPVASSAGVKFVATALIGLLSYASSPAESFTGIESQSIVSTFEYSSIAAESSVGTEVLSTSSSIEFSSVLNTSTLGLNLVSVSSDVDFIGKFATSFYGEGVTATAGIGTFSFNSELSQEFYAGFVASSLVGSLEFIPIEAVASVGNIFVAQLQTIEFVGNLADASTGAERVSSSGTILEFTGEIANVSTGAEASAELSTLNFTSEFAESNLGCEVVVASGQLDFNVLTSEVTLGTQETSSNSSLLMKGQFAIVYLNVSVFPTEDLTITHVSGDYYFIESV